MNHPTSIVHPFFGTLTFEGEVNWYVGAMDYQGALLKINFALHNSFLLDDQLTKAQTFLEGETMVNAVIAAADSLLTIKNSEWLDDNETPFTKDELLDFIDIDAIVFYADNRVDIYSYESDLFWGNRAIMRVNYDGAVISTQIEEDSMDEE